MTPIFLVLLVAIDPIIAQNGDPPTVLVRPQSQSVKAGNIASLHCTAEGSPAPQIQWRKNGKKLSQSQSRYLVQNYDNGVLLRIEPVKSPRDNNQYECRAENGVGDAVSAMAQLNVYDGLSSENSQRPPLDWPAKVSSPWSFAGVGKGKTR